MITGGGRLNIGANLRCYVEAYGDIDGGSDLSRMRVWRGLCELCISAEDGRASKRCSERL